MDDKITTHKVIYEFEVEIERIDGADEGMEYQARCSHLPGCTIHAVSREEAIKRIEQAKDVWIGYAIRQLDLVDFDIDDMIM